uniref:A-kinase anchoring protein 13 n=1 Tax=Malurus cyaneus samueli TaxID=2593467 RepID=A0A8C5XAC1_9PASS
DVVFYLVFTGSTVQHCTSTRKINPGSLETISPGHDCCETVKVALCASREGHPVLVVAEESFQFVQDEAYDAAQFLATCAGNQQALNFTRFLDRSRPPAADVDFLDEKVALAFRHLKLPAEWNVLGAEQSLSENIPRETLMHFAVRLGLLRLTWFLLQQPGGRGALSIHNNEGATPVSLALERGYQKLHQLLTEEGAREPDSWSTLSHTVHSGDYSVKHHRGLGVYLLTAETREGTAASWERDIQHLQMHMQSHQHQVSQGLRYQNQQEEKGNSRSLGAFNDAPNDTVSLGGANNAESLCESENTKLLCKKEGEAGLRSAECSGTLSDEDCTLSLCASVNGAVNLPSSGNTNEGAGMTSAGAVLDPAGVGSAESAHQEGEAAQEPPADRAAAVAAAPREGLDVAMGQTECRNCAGAPDRAEGQRRAQPGHRAANLTQECPAEEESPSPAQPLLGGFNGTECVHGEDVNVGVVPACDGDIGRVSAELCKTGSNKDGVDSCPAQVNGDFTESQGDGQVTAGQEVTVKAGETLPAVNGLKVPACASKAGPGLEVQGRNMSGEREGQEEASCTDEKSSLPSLEGSVETDGPDAEPGNRDDGGSNESGAEPAHCQESGEIAARGAAAMESSEKEPAGTDTSSCKAGGSRDCAGRGTEVAACHPCAAEAGVKGEMGDSFQPDTAGESERAEHEPAEDVSTGLAEKEPAQSPAEKAESAGEQEGRSSGVESSCPLPRGDRPALSQDGDAAVAPPGQEAALQGDEPGFAPCAKGSDCAQDNLIGTPSAAHNEESPQKQEAVAARAGSAELGWQHGEEHGGHEGSPERGLSQQDEGGPAQPEQEAPVNGKERVLSEEPSACSLGGPVVGSSNVDAGLKGTAQTKEVCGIGAVAAAEGAMHVPASADESLAAESDPCPNAGLNQEQDPIETLQRGSPHSSTPELKDSSEAGALSDAREGEEVPRPVPLTPAAAYPEQQEDTESVLPRAALHPIAEEPTCDSDSSTDTVCPAGDSDTAPAHGEGLAEPDGEQSQTAPELPFSPCSCRLQAVESLENAGGKRNHGENADVDVWTLQKASGCDSLCFASAECENFLEDGLSGVCASSQGGLKRESGSESDLFPLPGDGMEDLVFGKPEEEQSACDVTSSSSSADDTVSLERNSSLGSDTSLPFPPAGSFCQPKDRHSLDGSCTNMGSSEGGEKEEELDSITDVPAPSSVLRSSMRPLSPFRRHSWGPGKNATNEVHQTSQPQGFNFCSSAVSSPLTKSLSLMSISKPVLDSDISEESSSVPAGKGVTKVSRTFSYLRNKMSSSKKSKKEKDKKLLNGHLFTATSVVAQATCSHCMKPFNKDSYYCANCNAIVHKGCKESFASCAKVKMKPQRGMLQAHDTSSLPTVTMRNKSSQPKERPRSAILTPDENTVTSIFNNRRSQQPTALSKSVSIQNIAGVGNDDSLIHTWKFLSQSTDSLHKISRVNESMESLVDEGADMNEGQLMGDLELDSKQLEAESWSQVVDSKFLQQQNKDVVKRQDVIYELMQTEMHHVRTLKIMNDVYSAAMVKELQYDQQVVDKIFPCLENLLHIHSHFFQRILERKKESLADKSEKNFVIRRIGDILVNQFSGESAERMKKTYGKFCGHHNEAVNYFKDLYSKDKRFQAFVKKKMSSSLVRRLGIPECILLVTQRITKYPVLLQRILQYTKENEVEHEDLTQSLNLVKDMIAAVNSKVSNYEKKMRLGEIYNRTDSKSIMRMKSGQMFAREDLRHRKLIRDGPVSLKSAAGRLKGKDQKYVFASLDQKSTVISLKKLIVREVAHEEKALFLISMGGKDPEMVEVHASSKEERNGWIQIIQDTMNTMDRDEDEGVPCESEFEKKLSDAKVRGLKEQLQQKDKQILLLLEEKTKIFRDMADSSVPEEMPGSRLLFRANTEEAPKGEAIMKTAINEVELLQDLVNRSLGTALGQQVSSTAMDQEGGVGPISLPRRAETFGGFDSHQMNASKGGAKDEGDDAQDLRRTESDSILKKVQLCLWVFRAGSLPTERKLPWSLCAPSQGVVLQQDTYIEDQKLALSERALSRSIFRPSSLLEQEKQRNLEKQRQELANLKKQQTQHQEERRRREKEWEAREKELAEQEAQVAQREAEVRRLRQELEHERDELQKKKAAYQLDLEGLRTAQKQLEREKLQLKQEVERSAQTRQESDHNQVSNLHEKLARVSSQSSTDESSTQKSSSLPKQGHFDAELSVSPKRNSLSRTHKEKSTFHLLSTTNQTNKAAEEQTQMPTRLFSLAKPKEKKEKKKKGRGHRSQQSDSHSSEAPPEGEEIFC